MTKRDITAVEEKARKIQDKIQEAQAAAARLLGRGDRTRHRPHHRMETRTVNHDATRWREGAITWTSDEKLAKQFGTKREAVLAARVTGGKPCKIDRMGFRLWAVMDEQGRYVTETGYAVARQSE